MNLSSMFGNLRNYEKTKLMRKEIMKESHRDRSLALYSRKKVAVLDSDNEKTEESEDDAALFVKGQQADMKEDHLSPDAILAVMIS